MANFRENSKLNWLGSGSVEHINAGSLQRIADATEKMASNYTKMENDLSMYKRWYSEEQIKVQRLLKSNAALRGYIKRLKNKL